MRVYLRYIIDHLRATWNWRMGLSLLLLLAVLIGVNYSIELEDELIDRNYAESPLRAFWFFLLQGGSFLVAAVLVMRFGPKNLAFLKRRKFWFYLLFVFAVYGFHRGFYGHMLIGQSFPVEIRRPLLYLISELRSLLTLILPFILFYLFYDKRNQQHFYGVQLKGVDWKPYLMMLGIMIPFLYFFSTTADFQQQYPMYDRIQGFRLAEYWGISEYWVAGLYELLYGLDFFNTELFFRGILVFIFVRFLGPHAIYPIAVTYCVCHFGKPPVEAISSFFGGYILGVISLKSENIWGGVFVHMGIALLMELFAFLFV